MGLICVTFFQKRLLFSSIIKNIYQVKKKKIEKKVLVRQQSQVEAVMESKGSQNESNGKFLEDEWKNPNIQEPTTRQLKNLEQKPNESKVVPCVAQSKATDKEQSKDNLKENQESASPYFDINHHNEVNNNNYHFENKSSSAFHDSKNFSQSDIVEYVE
mmetsp:Transcript_3313/g.3289  ORF Transcript_3313/g.3289 Transcript_3313/m.3289 type:complete len:159 (+) Transcript_3313:250-726(+)